jgi:hypothetical protein
VSASQQNRLRKFEVAQQKIWRGEIERILNLLPGVLQNPSDGLLKRLLSTEKIPTEELETVEWEMQLSPMTGIEIFLYEWVIDLFSLALSNPIPHAPPIIAMTAREIEEQVSVLKSKADFLEANSLDSPNPRSVRSGVRLLRGWANTLPDIVKVIPE